MTGRPDIGVLTATVDQLQAEVDGLRRRMSLMLTTVLSMALIFYTFLRVGRPA